MIRYGDEITLGQALSSEDEGERVEETFDECEMTLADGSPLLGADDGTEKRVELSDFFSKFLSEDALQLSTARYVEEQSVQDIAQVRNQTVLQVARQLNKARELARQALSRL